MGKLIKHVFLTVFILFLVLVFLFVVLLILSVKGGNAIYTSFQNYAPPSCPNTKWVCQEADVYFISDARGMLFGVSRTAGDERMFRIRFGHDPEHFLVDSIQADENGVPRKDSDIISGSSWYSEKQCTLEYLAYQDATALFGEAEGTVTRTFLREDLPEPLDLARDAANIKWVCQEADIWFLSDENGQIHGESRVGGEERPFRLYCGQTPAYYSANVRRRDAQGHVTDVTAFCGAIWLDEERCFLQYEAGPLLDPLWEGEEGFVTLRFLREELPPRWEGDEPAIQWTCAEKDMQLEFWEDGTGYGDIIVDGEELRISLFFGPGETRFYADPEPVDGADPAPGLIGSISLEGRRCVLQFEAGQSDLFGAETEGPVTLTFLQENLPELAASSGSE